MRRTTIAKNSKSGSPAQVIAKQTLPQTGFRGLALFNAPAGVGADPETHRLPVLVAFYRGVSLPALAVRLWTRRTGQRFADVPSHCAVIIVPPAGDISLGGAATLYEFVSTGFIVRCAAPADLSAAVLVSLPDPAGAWAAARAGAGLRYDWAAIALDCLYKPLPARWRVRLGYGRRYDCAEFALRVLARGGWAYPLWLHQSVVPVSPNDLLRALTEGKPA